jgi:hypothetical protein
MYKYLSIFLAFCILVLGGFFAWDHYRLSKVADQLNSELMQSNLELGKAHTQFGDASKKIDELNAKLQAEIRSHQETVIQYNELWAKYQVVVHDGQGGSIPVPPEVASNIRPGDFYVADTNKLLHWLGPTIDISYLDVRLSALASAYSSTEDNKLSLGSHFDYTLNLNLKLKSVTTIAESGAVNNYAEIYEIDKEGKELGKFDIIKFESVVTDQRKPHFYWWAPHLDLGGLAGITTDVKFKSAFSLGFSAMGYGLTVNDLMWRFVRLGINLGDSVLGGDCVPVQYNLGSFLPLVSNLWVGPFVSYDIKLQTGIGLHVSLVL